MVFQFFSIIIISLSIIVIVLIKAWVWLLNYKIVSIHWQGICWLGKETMIIVTRSLSCICDKWIILAIEMYGQPFFFLAQSTTVLSDIYIHTIIIIIHVHVHVHDYMYVITYMYMSIIITYIIIYIQCRLHTLYM